MGTRLVLQSNRALRNDALTLRFSGSFWRWRVLSDEQTGSRVPIGQRNICLDHSIDALTALQGRCHTAVTAGNRIIFFGGSLPSTNCLSVLDTRSFTSRDVVLRGEPVQRRLSHCAAAVDGCMIIVGGWSVNSQRASTTLRDCFRIEAAVSAANCGLFFVFI